MIAMRAALLLLLGVALAPTEQAAVHKFLPRFDVFTKYDNGNRNIVNKLNPFGVPTRAGDRAVTDFIDQPLDHFNPIETETWTQRFWSNDALYKAGGPVFINIGGEWQESLQTVGSKATFMAYLAEKYGAKIYSVEHRYYGKSQPKKDASTSNLRYLSADQALADLAFLIQHLIDSGEISKDQKVVVFGGSYAGNLAAWARTKYPHLIAAAVSSSGPVLAKADFFEYTDVVVRSLNTIAGPNCVNNIKKGIDRVVELLETTAGYNKVKKVFQVGSDLKSDLDLHYFFMAMSSPFAYAAQYHSDKYSGTSYDIKTACKYLSSASMTADKAMEGLARAVLGSSYGRGNMDYSYKSFVDYYSKTSLAADASGEVPAMRQWLYQTCTEFGYYQTYNTTEDSPFPKKWNTVDFSYRICSDLFGTGHGQKLVEKGVARSNIMYGHVDPDITNVLYINGDLDPWHVLSVLEDVSDSSPAFLANKMSHCMDMSYPNSRYDNEGITKAHDKVEAFVKRVLTSTPNSSSDSDSGVLDRDDVVVEYQRPSDDNLILL